MTFNEINLALAGATSGALFGAIGLKLFLETSKSNWKWFFYILALISVLSAIMNGMIEFSKLTIMGWIIVCALLVLGIYLLYFTSRHLDKKNIYTTDELNPIINDFTMTADLTEIRLFGGDLSFLGNSPIEIDRNVQYTFLKSRNFAKICILCEEPKKNATKITYGKLLHELTGVELKFYRPDKADLQIRGRMITIAGAKKLLIYSKNNGGYYETIRTDTGNTSGALYGNIWDLIWSLAKDVTSDQRNEYIDLYRH